MLIGQYVRCPIVLEAKDEIYPRLFVLGQIIEINELSGEVCINLHDLKNSKRFYQDYFGKRTYAVEKIDRCGAAKDAPVNTPDGPGIIVSRRLPKDTDAFYEYYIMLHTGNIKLYMENELEIEYSAADYLPTKQLLRYEFQHPAWFLNRLKVSENMHMVNNTVYGFKELAGCRTFLMSHQISTIVRAFESRPIRYMLADEVGLGKTIEACSIVKILETEKKDLRVLYIIPKSLAHQWINELKYKFGIDAIQKTAFSTQGKHVIIPLEDLEKNKNVLMYGWDVLIVDETHRLLEQANEYNIILSLSKAINNVLLLSATPIQNRQIEYLRLLALLQPDKYEHMELSDFSYIVSKQKKIQRRVNGLISHMKQYEEYKEDSLEKIEELAEELGDERLKRLVGKIDLFSEDNGRESLEQAVSYISENYRIERNIVRNRRDFVSESLGTRVLVALPYTMKSSDENYSERNLYYSLLDYISAGIQDETLTISNALYILQAMFSSPWALGEAIASLKIQDNSLDNYIHLWTLQAEDEIKQVDYLLDESPEMIKGRLIHAIDYIEQEVLFTADNNGKIVVFSEFPSTLWKFGELLSHRGIECVCFTSNMLQKELEDSVYEFQNNENCNVILCDASGGEGRNFQNADWIIHLDLPWNANAIEQRIGRLDRLGRDRDHLNVNSVVIYSENSIETQLFKIWHNGLGLFERSLSGLEIITGELNAQIEDALLDDVYNGLENALENIIELAEDTRDAVEEEQLYDSGIAIYRPLSIAVRQMLNIYCNGENDLFRESMLGWAGQAGLNSTVCKDNIVQFSESMFSQRAAIQALFVPPDWELYQNSSIIRREGRILGTFNRSTAIKREDLLFYAPGDPVFDSIIGNALDNGRGRCCALEAYAPFNYKGYMFVYNVEPRISYLIERKIPIQLLSQFRMYLPMKQIIVFMPFRGYEDVPENDLRDFIFHDLRLREVEHLGRRAKKKDPIAPLDRFIMYHPIEEWKNTVSRLGKASKEKAIKLVSEQSDFETAKREMKRIVNGYESEYLYLGKDTSELENIRKKYSAVYYALSNPLIKLDSIGLLYLNN